MFEYNLFVLSLIFFFHAFPLLLDVGFFKKKKGKAKLSFRNAFVLKELKIYRMMD